MDLVALADAVPDWLWRFVLWLTGVTQEAVHELFAEAA